MQEAVSSYEVCVHCDGPVKQLTVLGTPMSARFRMLQAFRMPAGLFSVGLLVALYFLLSRLHRVESALWTIVFAALLAVVFWFAFFTVVHATARATDEVKAVQSIEARAFILQPSLRALGWCAAWLLPLLYVQSARGVAIEHWMTDSVAALACLLVAFVAPASLVVLACGERLRASLSPARLREVVQQIGPDYRVAVGLVLGATLFSLLEVVVWDFAVRQGEADLAILPRALALYAQFLTARTVGMLLDVHGYAVGYPQANQREVPALGDAEPTGTRKPKAPEPPPKPKQALELDLTPARPEGEPTPAQRVEEVLAPLRANDLEAAVAAFAALPESLDPWLSAASQLTLGQAAAARGQYALAVRALKMAARRAPEDPQAPRACVILARLYAERLGDAESAAKLYRYVVARYPDTDAARFAQSRLTPA